MPECVLLSPEEYIKIIDQLEEAELLKMAVSRIEKNDPANNIPIEKIMEKYNITREDIESMEEVEIA